jgi:hypothetical protein
LALLMALLLMCLPLLAARMEADAVHRAGYAAIAGLGHFAGALLLLGTALAAWLARRGLRLSAVAVLATGLIACWTLFSLASNELERWKGGTLLADDVAPLLRADTELFCLDQYPQVAIFTLARTCRIAGDYGELETQFDDGAPNWLRSAAEFQAAWAAAPRAVAVIEPRTADKWRALAVPAIVVAEKPYATILAKP